MVIRQSRAGRNEETMLKIFLIVAGVGVLGWVVTILNPNTGPAFSFSGATYDAAAYTIHGNSSGGYGGQIADLILVMDPITGELKGSLDDSLSPGELTFVAKPVRTVGTFFQASGDPSPAASIEGQYSGKWANYPSEILLKDFGTAGFAGKLAILGSSPIETSFHGGLLEESKGFLTLVGGSNGALLKIFVANHGGTWTGFSVSAEYGKVSELTLKKSAP